MPKLLTYLIGRAGDTHRKADIGQTGSCQRRLNVDPHSLQIAEVKLTHPGAVYQGEREGDLPPCPLRGKVPQ